jgi:hypothetical protein
MESPLMENQNPYFEAETGLFNKESASALFSGVLPRALELDSYLSSETYTLSLNKRAGLPALFSMVRR